MRCTHTEIATCTSLRRNKRENGCVCLLRLFLISCLLWDSQQNWMGVSQATIFYIKKSTQRSKRSWCQLWYNFNHIISNNGASFESFNIKKWKLQEIFCPYKNTRATKKVTWTKNKSSDLFPYLNKTVL